MHQLDKIEQQIKLLEPKIGQYKKLLLADDGMVDSKEQQQLNSFNKTIVQLKERIQQIKTHKKQAAAAPLADQNNKQPAENDVNKLFEQLNQSKQKLDHLKAQLVAKLKEHGINL